MKLPRQLMRNALQNVKAALSTDDFIQAMICFCFRESYVYAYDNVLCVAWPLETGIEGGVPGDALYKMINSLSVKTIEVSRDGNHFILKGGKSNFKASVLDTDKFILKPKDLRIDPKAKPLKLSSSFFDGIEKCSVSIGDDPIHPQHMGITLRSDGKIVSMYSTDNRSISRYRYRSKSTKFKEVVLPTKFCLQVLAMKEHLSGAFLYIGKEQVGVLSDRFFDGKRYLMFSKLLYTGEATDFDPVIAKYTSKKMRYFGIPKSFEDCLQRALIVIGSSIDRTTEIAIQGDTLDFSTLSDLGESKDRVILKGTKLVKGRHIIFTDLVLRACKTNDEASFGENAMAFKSGNYFHLVSYSSAKD